MEIGEQLENEILVKNIFLSAGRENNISFLHVSSVTLRQNRARCFSYRAKVTVRHFHSKCAQRFIGKKEEAKKKIEIFFFV